MIRRSRSTALGWAFLCSFLVYLLPVYTVHVSLVLGVVVWQEIIGGRAISDSLWFAANMALAAVLQLTLGGFFYWVFRGRAWLRALGLVIVFPALSAALMLTYFVVIPTYALIESETHGESGDWKVACEVDGLSLMHTRAGATLVLERAGEAWLIGFQRAPLPPLRHALLRMPACAVAEIAVPEGLRTDGIRYAVPGGAALYRVSGKTLENVRFYLKSPKDQTPRRVEIPKEARYGVILSQDGETVTWLHRVRGKRGATVRYEIRSRHEGTGAETAIPVAPKPRSSLKLLSTDPATGGFILAWNAKEVFGIDRAGATSWGPLPPPGFHIHTDNWLRVGKGWVAWEGYRDTGRYRVKWSLPAGAGTHEVPKGRAIKGVSVSPSGDLIAISVSSSMSIGSIKDAVYILRASDGAEVFRRFLRPHTRTQVTFLGDRFFAYTQYRTVVGRVRGRVIVLRRPDAGAK